MNEVQKSNAQMALEFYASIVRGEKPKAPLWTNFDGRDIEDTCPNFSNPNVRYFWPQEMVEHKGGKYPKPIEAREVVNGKQYFMADPLYGAFFDTITGCKTSDVFIRHVKRGVIHETKEAAIQHSKVMLGEE